MPYYFHRLRFALLLLPAVIFGQLAGEKTIKVSRECHGLRPQRTHTVDGCIDEGSGLVAWHGKLWTHNDSGYASLFAIDSLTGQMQQEYKLPLKNDDWEEICQDEHYFYLGNIGNNAHNREKLSIYRITKEPLLQNKVELDSITFEWPETVTKGKREKFNFDCEAMIALHDTLYLFTKEYKTSRGSRIFKIPATPKHHIAEYLATLKTRLLVTGATYSSKEQRVYLCGYNMLMSPRIMSFTASCPKDFKNICDAKETRIKRHLRQIEGIASFDGKYYYLISEATNLFLWRNKPYLYTVRVHR